MKGLYRFGILLLVMGLASCDRTHSAHTSLETFTVHGIILELTTDGHGVVVRHQAIPKYMAAMTMTFSIKDRRELSGLTPGDEIDFHLVVTDEDQWIEKLVRTGHRAVIPPEKPRHDSPTIELKDGALFPDESFLSESGTIHRFSEWRGRAVALTFIFTRCPMPTFCPLMSKNFGRARQALLSRHDGPTNWQFLSLSFDPTHDSPPVLAAYANNYREGNADRWLFGVLDQTTLSNLAPRLNLIVQNDGDSLMHNLRTVVIDLDGRIRRQFDGNEWTSAELVDAIVKAAQTSHFSPEVTPEPH